LNYSKTTRTNLKTSGCNCWTFWS